MISLVYIALIDRNSINLEKTVLTKLAALLQKMPQILTDIERMVVDKDLILWALRVTLCIG